VGGRNWKVPALLICAAFVGTAVILFKRAPNTDAAAQKDLEQKVASAPLSSPEIHGASQSTLDAAQVQPAPVSGTSAPSPINGGPSPYERAVRHLQSQSDAAPTLARLARAHANIANAEDDPEWTRPTERQLFDFIYAQPEMNGLEIVSVVCRKTGCELQLLGTMNDNARSRSGEGPGGWQAALRRLPASTLSSSLTLQNLFVTRDADLVVYVTVLGRKPIATSTNSPAADASSSQ
jgi:hypothetical protein